MSHMEDAVKAMNVKLTGEDIGELGVNFYDTAIAYQSGTSEQFVGRALRDFAKREDVVVATKFLPRTPEEIEQGKQDISESPTVLHGR